MVSDESLPDFDDGFFNIYSTKTITSTYHSLLEKLKSSNNTSGNKTIVGKKANRENNPCTSKDTSGNHINVNDPCTSKDTNKRHINLNDPCTSKGTKRRRINLNDPSTSEDTSRSHIILDDPSTSKGSSGSSIILDDSSGSATNEPSWNTTALVEENDLEVISNDSRSSTPRPLFTRIRLRRRTGKRRRGRGTGTGRGRGTGTGTGRGAGRGTGRGARRGTGRGAGRGAGRGTGRGAGRGTGRGTGRGAGSVRVARISESPEQTSEDEIIEVTPFPMWRTQIPEVVELSDDDDDDDDNDDDPTACNLTLEDEINYEVSVKVLWMSVTVETFNLRRFQKFTSVFEYFMKKENVPYENVLLKLRGIRISKNDTPDSLDLKVYDFIDGGVLSGTMFPLIREEPVKRITNDENCLTIKLQDKTKIVHKLTINKGEMMKLIMIKYAEQTEIPLKKMKFYFDGDIVNPSDTPDSLGISNDEIIDVKY